MKTEIWELIKKEWMLIITYILLGIAFGQRCHGQSWQDSNRGLYPQSIQATINAKNTAVGLRYGYLFREQPLGIYASFSNTIASNLDYNNYAWERKYSLGGMVQLPYNRKMRGIHTFFTLAAVYNSHDDPYDRSMNYTNDIGCDIGMEFQINRYKCHLTVDAINFMRYVEFGCGISFYKIRK